MSIRGLLFPVSCVTTLALVACGGAVKSESSTAPGTSPEGAPATSAAPSDVPVPGVVATTTVGELDCGENENALIVGSDDVQGFASFMRRNAFRPRVTLPRASRLVTFADPQGGLGVVFVERDGTYSQARTPNGEAFEIAPPADCGDTPRCFAPTANGPLVALGPDRVVGTVLVSGEVPRWTPAYFDSDAKTWVSSDTGVFAEVVGGLAAGSVGAESVLVYSNLDGHLVDSVGTAGTWQSPHVHADITVSRDAEIQVTSLAVGVTRNELTVFYRTVSNGALALGALTRRGGAWLAPVVTPFDATDSVIRFAVSGTPSGAFVVAGVRTSGKLELRRFEKGAFSGPLLTGETDVAPEGEIAMAPGICGDDAWLAYGASGGEVRAMRVRGNAISRPVTVVRSSGAPRPGRLSIITRAR